MVEHKLYAISIPDTNYFPNNYKQCNNLICKVIEDYTFMSLVHILDKDLYFIVPSTHLIKLNEFKQLW